MTRQDFLEQTKNEIEELNDDVFSGDKFSEDKHLKNTLYNMFLQSSSEDWKVPYYELIDHKWDYSKDVSDEELKFSIDKCRNALMQRLDEVENMSDEEFDKIFSEKNEKEIRHDEIMEEFDDKFMMSLMPLGISPDEFDNIPSDEIKRIIMEKEKELGVNVDFSWTHDQKWVDFFGRPEFL